MIKRLIVLLVAIIPASLYAQVTINMQIPPAGFVQKEQLWNLILVNNKEDLLEVNIKMNLRDAITGQSLLSAKSGYLLLGKGVKVITSRDVQPVLYNYTMQDFSSAYLPMGTYIVCYQLYRQAGEIEELLGDECVHINIDPLSPPMLNTPLDKSNIETPYPQFTWIPPTAIELFNSLTYDILVTEVNEGQTPVEAIQYNTPVYSRSGIQYPTDNYPSSFKALEKDKTYAWQVIAKNGLNYTSKTEVWSFKLSNTIKPLTPQKTHYYRLQQGGTPAGFVCNGILSLEYMNEINDKTVNISIYGVENKRKGRVEVMNKPISIKYQQNLIDIDLKKEGKLRKGIVYTVELTNSNNEVWTAKFEYSN